ncbi:HrgA protein [Providencia sp. R33]|uniref:COG2958 family protein n=1 Tax=Providencia sp. R33 TaxID=2828763 RepID=UPI001C5BA26D|nr:HrgA protein [Providencia sp. R33]QXX82774.1 HrgA protein [Providencia sp. R33]
MSTSKTRSLYDKTLAFLKQNQGKQYTAREIAEQLVKQDPDWAKEKINKSQSLTTLDDAVKQYAAEIGALTPTWLTPKKQRPVRIKTTIERPRKYYYSEMTDDEEIAQSEITDITAHPNEWTEHDLYPLLNEWLVRYMNAYSLRVNEKKSQNTQGKNGNKWLHPDLVGLEDKGQHWQSTLKACVNEYSEPRTRLWSFEVKKRINMSNVREVFFQTLSNSSWANVGYLVAAEITGDETLKELRMLCAAHHIGIILLDKEDIANTQILIQATEKENVDWELCNRLISINRDFEHYIELVSEFYKLGEVKKSDWKWRQ